MQQNVNFWRFLKHRPKYIGTEKLEKAHSCSTRYIKKHALSVSANCFLSTVYRIEVAKNEFHYNFNVRSVNNLGVFLVRFHLPDSLLNSTAY